MTLDASESSTFEGSLPPLIIWEIDGVRIGHGPTVQFPVPDDRTDVRVVVTVWDRFGRSGLPLSVKIPVLNVPALVAGGVGARDGGQVGGGTTGGRPKPPSGRPPMCDGLAFYSLDQPLTVEWTETCALPEIVATNGFMLRLEVGDLVAPIAGARVVSFPERAQPGNGARGTPGAEGSAGAGDGQRGGDGQPGTAGDPGEAGSPAGSVVIRAKALRGRLQIDNMGRDGPNGGDGGPGGRGGNGGRGSPATSGFFSCTSGPGYGGAGGAGGVGGAGGLAGRGGAGGEVILDLDELGAGSEIHVRDVGGAQGLPGRGGPGGPRGLGGLEGPSSGFCASAGRDGSPGTMGPDGAGGAGAPRGA